MEIIETRSPGGAIIEKFSSNTWRVRADGYGWGDSIYVLRDGEEWDCTLRNDGFVMTSFRVSGEESLEAVVDGCIGKYRARVSTMIFNGEDNEHSRAAKKEHERAAISLFAILFGIPIAGLAFLLLINWLYGK